MIHCCLLLGRKMGCFHYFLHLECNVTVCTYSEENNWIIFLHCVDMFNSVSVLKSQWRQQLFIKEEFLRFWNENAKMNVLEKNNEENYGWLQDGKQEVCSFHTDHYKYYKERINMAHYFFRIKIWFLTVCCWQLKGRTHTLKKFASIPYCIWSCCLSLASSF